MERLSDSDSDEDARDETDRRLSSLVLRPAITSLPSIDDDPDSDDGDSSSEAEVVFSSINWAAQESTGFPFDYEPTSPGPVRPVSAMHMASAGVGTEAQRRGGEASLPLPTASSASSQTIVSPSMRGRAAAAAPRGEQGGFLTAGSTGTAVTALGSSPRMGAPPTPIDSGAADAAANDPDELYEGRGWLAGAAGRLANVAERKRAGAAATDAEQVAAAARDATALLQHRHQHQDQKRGQQGLGADAPPSSGGAAGEGVPGDSGAAALVQRRRAQEEAEQRILQDFQETLRAAETEPPMVASSGLSLEATVAGLEMEDLDALIARLSAAAAATAAAAASGSGGGGGSGVWAPERLPAAESLWSDEEAEEEESVAAVAGGRQAAVMAPVAASAPTAQEVHQVLKPAPGRATEAPPPAAAAAAATAPALPPSAAAPAPPAAEPAAAAGSAPPPPLPGGPLPGGPLPAKFKFFGAPAPSSAPPHLTAPPPGAAAAAAAGPVVQDLRQSIAETAQRHSVAAAAAAAQRESQAKAAAAKRRLVTGVDSDDEDGEEEEDGAAAAARAAARRPVPKALPVARVPAPSAGAAARPSVAPTAPPAVAAAVSATASTAAAAAAATAAAPAATPAPRATATFAATAEPGASPPQPVAAASGDGGGGSETAKTSASVGTDSADLRPVSRSVFVCTAERKVEEEEEEERARNIREYLKARAAAAAAEQQRQRDAAAAAAAAAAATASERRWPEPPAEVAQRIAAVKDRSAGAAAATSSGSADSKSSEPRAVSTFTGGFDAADGVADGATGVPASASASRDASDWRGHTANGVVGPTATAASPAASRAFAACSTEGDEDLVSDPAPASVVDASRERGSRMAAAGTFISLGAPAASSSSKATNGHGGSRPTSASLHSPSAAPAAAAAAAPAAAAARPSALELPPPVPAAAVAYVAPTGTPPPAAASSATTPAAKSPATGAAARGPAAAAPSDLCLLPAWLPPSSCFTLLLASPSNMPSREVGAVLAWLLGAAAATAAAASTPTSSSASQPAMTMPAFSVVGARLLGVAPNCAMLPPVAAAFFRAAAPAGSAAAGGGDGEVRLLAVACVPRAGLDPDAYSHEMPATAAADTAAAVTAAQQLAAALAPVSWSAVLAASGAGGNVPADAAALPAAAARLGTWASTQPGAQLLFSPLRLPPHALSHYQPRSSTPGGATSPSAAGGLDAAAGGPGSSTFLCMVASGTLRNSLLLPGLLARASCLGLTLRGLQVVYSTEEAAAAVVSSTPHRPLPYIGAAVLALSGRNEPLRRWQAQLGPPDARLAARTDPSSLHALYGDIARHITCSYDAVTASREVSALFAVSGDAQAAQSSPRAQQAKLPPTTPSASPKAAAAAAAEQGPAGVCWLTVSGVPQSQWLALPACGAVQQAVALWCVQHLLWCGFSLRGLLLVCLPPASDQQQQQQQVAGALGLPTLVLEASKEEASEQLPLLLANLPPFPGAGAGAGAGAALTGASITAAAAAAASSNGGGPGHAHAAAAAPQPPQPPSLLALRSLLPSAVLRSRLRADIQSLPQPYIADQLLASAIGEAALDSPSDGAFGAAAAPPQLHLHHGEDGIAVVALQARPLHAAALLLAALTAHATCSGASQPSPGRLELVACRYLRQVPSDVASCLTVLQPQPGAASAGGAGGAGAGLRPAQRLVISHPALLAVFHGPAAQARVAQLLQTALQRLQQAGSSSGAPELSASGKEGGAAWGALLDRLLGGYPTAASPAAAPPPPPPPLAAVSGSQAAAKRALAYAFTLSQVFLDAGMHDGLHRPPLPAAASPLLRLLAGPERLSSVVALDFTAMHRNVLPRLLKQLSREGYALHAAATCLLQPGGTAAAAMPSLAGQPAVLLHVSRSNAVLHLRSLAASLAAMGAGSGGGGSGLYTCGTWRDAAAVVSEVWPATASSGQGVLAPPGGGAAAGAPARRFIRPEGSRLLQLTTMVVTPSVASEGGGAPSLDWPRLADALEALHTEGFRLSAVRAAAATPRDLADLSRASCRISPAQQHAVHVAAAATAAESAAAAAAAIDNSGPADSAAAAAAAAALSLQPLASNLVLLALARDNAVTSLQILLDEATKTAAASRREAATALAAVAPCVSVSHSPAAAEQQATAVFDGVFGVGGVPLVR